MHGNRCSYVNIGGQAFAVGSSAQAGPRNLTLERCVCQRLKPEPDLGNIGMFS